MLEALAITAGYEQAPVISEVTLKLARGQFVGLVGPNGSGKSTVVRAVSRVLRPQRGEVALDGVDIYRMSARAVARRLAVVAQDNAVGFDFPVREIVLMGRAPHLPGFGIEGPEDYAIADRCMALTHTASIADRPITRFSLSRLLFARRPFFGHPYLGHFFPGYHVFL